MSAIVACLFSGFSRSATGAPLLWKTGDADSTIFLFGTMHVLKSGMDWESPAVARALHQSDTLWLETETLQAEGGDRIKELGSSPGEPLSERLEPDLLESVANLSRNLGVDFRTLDGMRPWLAAASLGAAALKRDGYSGTGVDLALAGEAGVHDVIVAGLDPIDRPLELFASLAPASETALLANVTKDLASSRPQYEPLVAAWMLGDEAGLVRHGLEPMKSTDPVIYETLIARRNRSWLPEIEKLMLGRGTHFVAVGALHLVGPDSLQTLLRQDGHVVDAVP